MTEIIDRSALATLSESVGEDFLGELIDTFVEEAPGLFHEMRQALAAGDADSFRRAAHSLKTNANTFGASQLAEKAKALESMARENNLEVGDRVVALENAYEKAVEALKTYL